MCMEPCYYEKNIYIYFSHVAQTSTQLERKNTKIFFGNDKELVGN